MRMSGSKPLVHTFSCAAKNYENCSLHCYKVPIGIDPHPTHTTHNTQHTFPIRFDSIFPTLPRTTLLTVGSTSRLCFCFSDNSAITGAHRALFQRVSQPSRVTTSPPLMLTLERAFTILLLLLCNSIHSSESVELKQRPTKSVSFIQGVDETPLNSIDSIKTMSIVDAFVGNRGKGSNTGGLLYRRGQVFYTAAVVFADYKYVQWKCNNMQDADEAVINDIWNKAHERNAEFLGNKFISLEGLWVKLGQYLSSRADVMPDPYLRVLSKCQVPSDTFRQ